MKLLGQSIPIKAKFDLDSYLEGETSLYKRSRSHDQDGYHILIKVKLKKKSSADPRQPYDLKTGMQQICIYIFEKMLIPSGLSVRTSGLYIHDCMLLLFSNIFSETARSIKPNFIWSLLGKGRVFL